jgi:hypothetical protein
MMFHQLAKRLTPIAAGLAMLAATPAFAATVYESASYTGDDTGEYIVQDGRSIGAVFTLAQTTNITGIGAQFGGFPGGSIFGAIVSLASPADYPAGDPANLASIALAHVVFSVPTVTAVDLIEPLSVTLSAGSYAVIFGSGQFGADGYAGLGELNDTIGSPTMIQTLFDDTWQSQDADGIRIVVEGSAVPEPASWAMMIGGFGLVGSALRLRRRTTLRTA